MSWRGSFGLLMLLTSAQLETQYKYKYNHKHKYKYKLKYKYLYKYKELKQNTHIDYELASLGLVVAQNICRACKDFQYHHHFLLHSAKKKTKITQFRKFSFAQTHCAFCIIISRLNWKWIVKVEAFFETVWSCICEAGNDAPNALGFFCQRTRQDWRDGQGGKGEGGDGFQCHPCLSQVFANYVASIEPVPMKNLQPLFEFCNFCSDQFAFYLILQYGTRDGGFGEGWIILRGHGKDGVMNLLVLSPPPHTNCGVTRVMKGNGISLTLSL